MKKLVVGIDIGGTNTIFGFVDKTGNTLWEGGIPTKGYPNIEDYLEVLAQAIKANLARIPDAKSFEIVGVGMGAPNGNYYKGTIEEAPNLEWKGIVPIINLFKKHFDVPMMLTNDANAAAMGEFLFGAAKGLRDFIVITLGTGLGSGIFVNGELVYGHDGHAGELGHLVVNPNGRQCGCGRRGCLETYVSATGIKRTVFKLLADTTYPSELRNISFDNLTAEMISQLAKKGDKVAMLAFEYTGNMLGRKLADAVTVTSPKAIFLFGGLAKAGKFILDPTQKSLEDNVLSIFKNKVKVLPSGLLDRNVAVLGAAALVWKHLEPENQNAL